MKKPNYFSENEAPVECRAAFVSTHEEHGHTNMYFFEPKTPMIGRSDEDIPASQVGLSDILMHELMDEAKFYFLESMADYMKDGAIHETFLDVKLGGEWKAWPHNVNLVPKELR